MAYRQHSPSNSLDKPHKKYGAGKMGNAGGMDRKGMDTFEKDKEETE